MGRVLHAQRAGGKAELARLLGLTEDELNAELVGAGGDPSAIDTTGLAKTLAEVNDTVVVFRREAIRISRIPRNR